MASSYSVEVTPVVFDVEGRIECVNCGTEQPFTSRRCIECRQDPWEKSSHGGNQQPQTLLGVIPPANMEQDLLNRMIEMKFDPQLAEEALKRCNNRIEEAIEMCQTGAIESTQFPEPSAPRMLDKCDSSDDIALSPNDFIDGSIAAKHAECAICFEPMCSKPLCIFVDSTGKRICAHLFHSSCANDIALASSTCPLCRRHFHACVQVPNAEEDQKLWFKTCDFDGDGKLNMREVVDLVSSQYPVDYKALEKQLPKLWTRWDSSKDGYIDMNEFLGPDGLLEFIQQKFCRTEAEPTVMIPDVRKDKAAWFAHFDEDTSGELCVEEVVRGVIKSYHMSSHPARMAELRAFMSNIWFLFDHDKSGEIDLDEFIRPEVGMGDMLIANIPLA